MRCFYCIGLMLCVFFSRSQSDIGLFKQHRFHVLNEKNGLTNNVVNDILQDTLGQVWVATEEGLYRYQGLDFQKFLKDKNSQSPLHNNFIDQLYLDRSNNVWMMTDDGVGRYSYETDIIERVFATEITGRISSMVMDSEENIYFGQYESGIIRVSGDSIVRLNLLDDKSGINFGDFSILELAFMGRYLWANVSDIGVIRYDLSSENIVFFSATDITNSDKVTLNELYIDPLSNVWIGTDAGVYSLKVDMRGSKIVGRELEELLPPDDYLSIFLDADNMLWVGSRQNGLYGLSNPVENKYQIESHSIPQDDPFSVSHRSISNIFQEKNGYFWLGTHNGGINVFNPKGEVVRTVTKLLHSSDLSLSYQNVWGICEANDGSVWVGTDGKGISMLNPKTGLVDNSVIQELNNKAVLSVLEDSQKRIWIGTYQDGIYLFDQEKNQLDSFQVSSQRSELWVNDIRCFYELNGKIFIGTNQGGLYVYDEVEERVIQLNGVPLLDIRSITSDNSEYLWLGTFGRGVQKYSISQNMLVESGWESNDQNSTEMVFDLVIEGGVLWAATRHNGVLGYDMIQRKFRQIAALESMSGKSVSALVLDKDKKLWFTLNTGVVSYDTQTEEFKEFGEEDGFQFGHFNFGSMYLSNDGYIAAGGIHGLNIFYPDALYRSESSADIVINQFKLFNETATPVNSVIFKENQSIFLSDKVTLNYEDNIFSIGYSLPGFTRQSKRDFQYKLSGYEEEWRFGNGSNLATYRNVPPGIYEFAVRSIDNSSSENLLIEVEPPLWRTWQALVLYMFLLLIVLRRLNRFSNSRIALKQKLLFEQELREKEGEIMQEKLRFYTNFSHELKTPLTLIQGPVNDLIKGENEPGTLVLLDIIRKNTNLLERFINKMLEFRKVELKKTLLNVGYHDLYILAQEEAESFTHLAKENGIIFGFYCEQDLLAWVDLEKVQIIINNLLSNAFKFSPTGKTVKFGLFHKENDIVIEVKNEGKGIGKEELKAIFMPFFQAENSVGTGGSGIGLALCKSFIELHKGIISVESQSEGGTTFTVTLKKQKDHFDDVDYVRFIETAEEVNNEIETIPEEVFISANEEPVDSDRLLLIVDDNRDISTYIKLIFIEDFKIVVCNSGQEAIDQSVRLVPDLIISDIMMPGIDGLEFCEKVKAHFATSHIPIVLLTAKNSDNSKIKGYNVGADDYITKPFNSDVLKVRVSNLLSNRKSLKLKYGSDDLVDPTSAAESKEAEFILNTETKIVELLDQTDLGVPELCQVLGMSQTSLYRKVKSITGDSILAFIRKIKIKRAAKLFVNTDMNVTEVCYAMYFSDPKYFRKCFKEQYDLSPNEYKNKHRVVPLS